MADDAYDALARLKKPGQSFSEVVRELVATRRPRLEDVRPPRRSAEEDAYWVRFKAERAKARRVTLRRVRLGD